MNFYERYCGDYGRDTGDLSLSEHGAYTLMLDHYYSTEKPLPADLPALYRICRAMNGAEREAVRAVADRFFPVGEDGHRHNSRADEEIESALPKIHASRKNGRKGGRPKKNPTYNPDETYEKPSGLANGNPTETHSGDPHAPRPKVNQSPASAGSRPDGLPCPHEQIIALYHEILPTCPRVAEWGDARQALLRSRWREKAKPNGRSQGYATAEAGLEYWKRFFAWVSQSDFLTGKSEPQQGRAPFVASLEWLVKPSNFVKIIEGNYHR